MKSARFILVCLLVAMAFSCKNDDDQYEIVNIAIPQAMSKAEFRNSVEILSPQSIGEAGKIYAYNNYIFVNDKYKGVHIINNTNPEAPSEVAFLKIPGNVDISVKENFLYADSAIDLVVFDISDINNIKIVNRLKDVFDIYDYQIPEDVSYADYNGFDSNEDVIVGWEVKQERRLINTTDERLIDIAVLSNESANFDTSSVGKAGSLARFQIVEDYLYTVTSHEMTIFNIGNLSQPTFVSTKYSGNNIETLFQADGFLYIGSTDGMYIYSLDNPSDPNYVSEFVHWTGCDPVIVDGNYAYLTIRSGNNCGEQESVLEIIDVSDKNTPMLAASYGLDNPYGLGIKDNVLFICDGSSGLKVFDRSDPINVELKQTFADINAKDVIPLTNSLLMIADNILYQYQYYDSSIKLLSTYQMN